MESPTPDETGSEGENEEEQVEMFYAPPKQSYKNVEEKEARARNALPMTTDEAQQWLKSRGFKDVRQIVLFEEEHYMNNEEFSPMSFAAETGELAMMKWLYENGARDHIGLLNKDGNTPMGHACYGGHLECCKWLYSLGPPCTEDTRRVNLGGTSPFLMAAMEGRFVECHHYLSPN